MSEFKEPKLAITKVYTKTGDRGKTGLVGGQRVPKSSLRIECYGTVDELNAFVGSAKQSLADFSPELASCLERIQHELFNLGSILATLPEDVGPNQPRIRSEEVARLEKEMDLYNRDLPALRSFVLPGGSRANTELHICRTVCRRAERYVFSALDEFGEDEHLSMAGTYLNRLSDAFFVWSRWVLIQAGIEEHLWKPNT